MSEEGIYLIDEKGRFFFTKYGRELLGSQFKLAGINMDSIKTKEQYLVERKKTFPYFMESMIERAESSPNDDECNLLKTIVFGTLEEGRNALRRYDVKRSLRVIG